MTQDEAKDEALRLCGPMHLVCMELHKLFGNSTAIVVQDGAVYSRPGRLAGSVRFSVHAPVGSVGSPVIGIKVFFNSLSMIDFKGMQMVRAEHKLLLDTICVYEAEFSWKLSALWPYG